MRIREKIVLVLRMIGAGVVAVLLIFFSGVPPRGVLLTADCYPLRETRLSPLTQPKHS